FSCKASKGCHSARIVCYTNFNGCFWGRRVIKYIAVNPAQLSEVENKVIVYRFYISLLSASSIIWCLPCHLVNISNFLYTFPDHCKIISFCRHSYFNRLSQYFICFYTIYLYIYKNKTL